MKYRRAWITESISPSYDPPVYKPNSEPPEAIVLSPILFSSDDAARIKYGGRFIKLSDDKENTHYL